MWNPIKGFRFIFKEREYISLGIWNLKKTFEYSDVKTGNTWETTIKAFNDKVKEREITCLGNHFKNAFN